MMGETMLKTATSFGKKVLPGVAASILAVSSLTSLTGCGCTKEDRALMKQSIQAADESKAAAARADAASKRLEDLAVRLEAAARKAEDAASRADAATNRATDAAGRAESTAKKTERIFEKGLMK